MQQVTSPMVRKLLLACGVIASILYVATDVVAAICYPAYHSFRARVVSELMASGAPTERLVDPLFLLYGALMIAFAIGLWLSGERARLAARMLLAYGALGLLGPTLFEMNVRGSGASPTADTLHIALTGVIVLLILGTVAVGAFLGGHRFRVYSLVTIAVLVLFGVATSFAMRGVATGEPTPWVGLLERVDIGAFLLWIAVLAIARLRAARQPLLLVAR
jgi:hypothetical protein